MIGKLIASAVISLTVLSTMAAVIFTKNNVSLSKFSTDELIVHGLFFTAFVFAATINLFGLMGGIPKKEGDANQADHSQPKFASADE
jgi:hypothetical protein